MTLHATAYIRAESEAEAVAGVRAAYQGESFEFDGAEISGRPFDDPALPLYSLSPAMTGGTVSNSADKAE